MRQVESESCLFSSAIRVYMYVFIRKGICDYMIRKRANTTHIFMKIQHSHSIYVKYGAHLFSLEPTFVIFLFCFVIFHQVLLWFFAATIEFTMFRIVSAFSCKTISHHTRDLDLSMKVIIAFMNMNSRITYHEHRPIDETCLFS